jgi:hypothetical protein
MTGHEKAWMDAIRAVLEPEGFIVEFHCGKKHNAARITAPDESVHKIALSGSGRSGDKEAGDYGRQAARRLLREFKPDMPWTKDDPMLMDYHVLKRNGRFHICDSRDSIVYTVPDFLRGYLRSRQPLNDLAAAMGKKPADKHIRLIAKFETALRPD